MLCKIKGVIEVSKVVIPQVSSFFFPASWGYYNEAGDRDWRLGRSGVDLIQQ